MRIIIFLGLFIGVHAWAQCPGEDSEPGLTVKLASGTTLFVCGMEDRDVSVKGKKAFSDFTVLYELGAAEEESAAITPPPPVAGTSVPAGAAKGAPSASAANGTPSSFDSLKAFSSDPNETYWVKAVPNKGLEIEELWFFTEKPTPAFRQEITCTKDACAAGAPKCILKMKPNPFPKALRDFKRRLAAGTLKDDGEELLDQIFAQAFTGNKEAKEFYAAAPAKLDPELSETFTANQKKLAAGCYK